MYPLLPKHRLPSCFYLYLLSEIRNFMPSYRLAHFLLYDLLPHPLLLPSSGLKNRTCLILIFQSSKGNPTWPSSSSFHDVSLYCVLFYRTSTIYRTKLNKIFPTPQIMNIRRISSFCLSRSPSFFFSLKEIVDERKS